MAQSAIQKRAAEIAAKVGTTAKAVSGGVFDWTGFKGGTLDLGTIVGQFTKGGDQVKVYLSTATGGVWMRVFIPLDDSQVVTVSAAQAGFSLTKSDMAALFTVSEYEGSKGSGTKYRLDGIGIRVANFPTQDLAESVTGLKFRLAEKILAVLRRPALRKTLVESGREEVAQMSWDLRGQHLHDLYRELVS